MEENKSVQTVPANYTPISAWGYVGYQLLFCIPLVGFIFMLVWAFNNGNINRRNFARSYLIFVIAGVIISVISIIVALLLGVGLSSLGNTSISSYGVKY